jgi:hypothetical protein
MLAGRLITRLEAAVAPVLAEIDERYVVAI